MHRLFAGIKGRSALPLGSEQYDNTAVYNGGHGAKASQTLPSGKVYSQLITSFVPMLKNISLCLSSAMLFGLSMPGMVAAAPGTSPSLSLERRGIGTGSLQNSPGDLTPAGPVLTLADAVAEGLANNPTVRTNSAQVTATEARLAQARAQRRLQISFNSTVTGNNAAVATPPPAHETFGTLQNTLTIPLPFGEKPSLAERQAQALLTAAQAQYQTARLALSTQIITAYFDVLRKQALLQIAQENYQEALRQEHDAKLRNQAGDVAQLDVLRAEVPVAAANSSLLQAETAARLSEQALNNVVGRSLDEPVRVLLPVGPPLSPEITLERARALVEKASGEIKAADANVAAQEAALRTARLWRAPALALTLSDLRSGDVTGLSRQDTIGASFTIPLTDGGLGRAQVREAEAMLTQTMAQADVTRRSVLANISSGYLTAESSRSQVEAARVARDIAQVTYDKTVLGNSKGLFALTDVLNAHTALVQARIQYAQAVFDGAAANSLLEIALGKETP